MRGIALWTPHPPLTGSCSALKGQTLSVRLAGVDAPEVLVRLAASQPPLTLQSFYLQMSHFGKAAQPFSEEAFALYAVASLHLRAGD